MNAALRPVSIDLQESEENRALIEATAFGVRSTCCTVGAGTVSRRRARRTRKSAPRHSCR